MDITSFQVRFALLIFIGLITTDVSFSQGKIDSLQKRKAHKKDSVLSSSSLAKINVDSLQGKLPQLPDSLMPSFQRMDSVRNSFNNEADSLKNKYQSSVGKVDSEKGKVNHTIDSLEDLHLPTGKYTKQLDSLQQARSKLDGEFTTKADALKAKTTDKLKGLDLPPQYNEPLQQITQSVDGFNLKSDFVKIPELNVPGYSLPKLNGGGLGDLSLNTNGLAKIPGVPKVETPLGDLSQLTDKAKGYGGDLKNISSGNLNDVKELPKTIEDQAGKIDGVGALQKETAGFKAMNDKLGAANNPQAAKDKAAAMVKEVAVDHFAGKEEQLKAAMDKISKYKQKYSSVSSLKDLPKRPPNAMKGKPFIERLIPGLYLQYQQKNYLLFDFNPYAGYRIGGRFTSGLGWNQRYAYSKKNHEWNSRSRIFGPRVYVDFNMGKGFIAHLESEMMNAFVPSTIVGNPDTGKREWVWDMMTGLKKEYKIYKNLKGTVLIQYNLFNPHYKAPYVDRLNSRIGFEYSLKKKKLTN
jgi:hypothetical protein